MVAECRRFGDLQATLTNNPPPRPLDVLDREVGERTRLAVVGRRLPFRHTNIHVTSDIAFVS